MLKNPVMDFLGLVPRKVEDVELQAGDHICTDRNLATYFHHGIFMGNDRVIHFSRVSKTHPPKDEDKCSCHEDTTTDEPSGVRMCCLKCFVRRKPGHMHLHPHSLYIFEYGISSWHSPLSVISVGSSHHKSSEPAEVVKRATEMLKTDKFGEYHLESRNCETFAFFCKTGKSHWYGSNQVRTAAAFVAAIATL